MESVETAVAARREAHPIEDRAAVRVQGKFFFAGESKFFVKGVTYGPFAPAAHGTQFPEPDTRARRISR